MNRRFMWLILLLLFLFLITALMRWNRGRQIPEQDSYSQLQKLLESGQWEAADVETSKLIVLGASGRRSAQASSTGVSFSEFANFPCTDLLLIDQLWRRYSNNQFGFSIQQSIWQPTDNPIAAESLLANQERFNKEVGWQGGYLKEENYSLAAPRGHLPSSLWLAEAAGPKVDGMDVYKLDRLLSRTRECYTIPRQPSEELKWTQSVGQL